MFTDQQLVDLRRFCGVPLYGSGQFTIFSNRYYARNLLFEYRIANLTTTEESTIINVFLTNLYTLENAIPASSDNLDTDTAAIWKHNKYEVRDRVRLFNYWRRRLVSMIFNEEEMVPLHITV